MANNNRSSKSGNSSHNKPTHWLTKHEYNYTPIKKDWGEKHEDFQIDATMSIRQMVQRFNSGQSVPISNVEYFENEMPHPSADLAEKMEFLKYNDHIVQSEIQNKPPEVTQVEEKGMPEGDISPSD